MIEIDNVLVSSEVLETYFTCDLKACKGACCIEGESGAPLINQEMKPLCKAVPLIMNYLPESNREYMDKNGLMYEDADGDMVTQIVDGGRCVFTCFEEDGSARCAFEKAYSEGKNDVFYKPISCHLFPIRVSVLRDGRHALNYSRWRPICEPARALGKHKGVRVYQFLKEPLIRAYGEEWYDKLVEQAMLYLEKKEGNSDESK